MSLNKHLIDKTNECETLLCTNERMREALEYISTKTDHGDNLNDSANCKICLAIEDALKGVSSTNLFEIENVAIELVNGNEYGRISDCLLAKRLRGSIPTNLSAIPTQELEELRKDKELLDWLESNLDRYDIECNLAAEMPFWFTRGVGHKIISFGEGKTLRQALTAAAGKVTI